MMREFNAKELDSLDFDGLCNELKKRGGEISLLNVVALPEADVLCCEYVGRKLNVKFDLDYGVSIEAIDDFSDDELLDFANKLKKYSIG